MAKVQNGKKTLMWLCKECGEKVVPTLVVKHKGSRKFLCVCQGFGASARRMRDVAVEKYGR